MPLLYVDGRRIQIVLRNLLENAHRYGGPDVLIEISATYEHEQAKKRAGLTLHISDNGPGILYISPSGSSIALSSRERSRTEQQRCRPGSGNLPGVR